MNNNKKVVQVIFTQEEWEFIQKTFPLYTRISPALRDLILEKLNYPKVKQQGN